MHFHVKSHQRFYMGNLFRDDRAIQSAIRKIKNNPDFFASAGPLLGRSFPPRTAPAGEVRITTDC
jgi:hypothetical protein